MIWGFYFSSFVFFVFDFFFYFIFSIVYSCKGVKFVLMVN